MNKIEKAENIKNEKGKNYKSLISKDVRVLLNKTTKVILTEIFYLPHNSEYHSHVRDNMRFNLAKRIIVFVSCPNTMKKQLSELKTWLVKC